MLRDQFENQPQKKWAVINTEIYQNLISFYFFGLVAATPTNLLKFHF